MSETTHSSVHEPVMLAEAVDLLSPRAGGVYCDGTVGYGGHARLVLERSAPTGRLIGLDRDPAAVAAAREALAGFGARVTIVHATFSRLREVLQSLALTAVDGCLVDLGVSSPQLDRPERGFSFMHAGPLDMRMDPTRGESAADLLAHIEEDELAAVLRDLGEERHARRIARAICAARAERRIDTTQALAELIARVVPRRERKHPATRTFQALRIAVNHELEELQRLLDEAPSCLAPGGRLVIIAFHSLEDRMVKHRFRALAQGGSPADGTAFRLLTKKAVMTPEAEQTKNPRARSARLRAIERLPS